MDQEINQQKNIQKNIANVVQLIIQNNNWNQFVEMVDKDQIKEDSIISTDDQNLSVLHFLARFNRAQMLEYIIKHIWHTNKTNFCQCINKKSQKTKYTPLAMAIQFRNNICVEIFFKLGGLDLTVTAETDVNLQELSRVNKCYIAEELINKFGLIEIQPNEEQLNKFSQEDKLTLFNEWQKNQQNLKCEFNLEEQMKQFPLEEIAQGVPETSKTYQMLLQCIKSKKNFTDQEILQSAQTLCTNQSHEYYKIYQQAVWLRPHEIFQCNDYKQINLFNKDIIPSDVRQGYLGICYFLSAIASIAENQDRLKNIFINKVTNPFGVYGVRLFINGKEEEVIVDDYFPCESQLCIPLFAYPNGFELWAMILEKAFLKQFKEFSFSENSNSEFAFEEILGFPSKQINIKNISDVEQIFSIVKQYDQLNYIMTATSKQSCDKGIHQNHVYSIIKVYEYQQLHLYQIRNPWGFYEFKGDYNDNSNKWTNDMKKLVDYKNSDDGIFYMTSKEFNSNFENITICFYKENQFFTSLQLHDLCQNQDYYYTFSINKVNQAELSIRVIQEFNKYRNAEEIKYIPCEIELMNIDKEKQYYIVAEGENRTYFGAKSINLFNNLFQKLEKGKYCIRLRLNNQDQKTKQMSIVVISDNQKIEFEMIIDNNIGLEYKIKALKQYGSQYEDHIDCKITENMGYKFTWLKYIGLFYIVNKEDKNLNLNIEITLFQNIKIGPYNKKDDSTISVVLKPKESTIAWVEKIDPRAIANTAWKYNYTLTN